MPNLIRVIVIAGIIWLVYRLFKRWRAQTHELKNQRRDKANEGIESIVECQHCGLHIPERDAIVDATGSFCSKAHQAAYHSKD